MSCEKLELRQSRPQHSLELTSFTEEVLRFIFADERYRRRKVGWVTWYHAIPNNEKENIQRIARVEFYDTSRGYIFVVGETSMNDFHKWRIVATIGPRTGRIEFPSLDDPDVHLQLA